MQPNSREVGVILEPTDIDIANNMRALLWEKYDNRGQGDTQESSFKFPLQPNENGVLELGEEEARRIASQASLASREVTNVYKQKDKKLDSLIEARLFDTEEYKTIEVVLPQLENRIRAFSSFVTSTEACISESQARVTGNGIAAQ